MRRENFARKPVPHIEEVQEYLMGLFLNGDVERVLVDI